MTRHHSTTYTVRRPRPPERTPRLRLKPEEPQTGCLDGAWWPYGDDLMIELPGLLAVLAMRLGPVDRFLYTVGDWATAPAELVTADGTVRLDGRRLRAPNTIEVLGWGGRRTALLVVPPHTGPDRAHATMMAAAAANNESTVDDLLMISVQERESRTQRGAAQERWDSESGAAR